MQLDKAQIIELLEQRGDQKQAEQARQRLPEKIDTDEHGGLLAQHGVSVQELMDKFGGDLGKLL
jgi:hypothetical protein